jgi:ABC-type nitrate/sulfonate/bicarbonate transport system substrate-binding protein
MDQTRKIFGVIMALFVVLIGVAGYMSLSGRLGTPASPGVAQPAAATSAPAAAKTEPTVASVAAAPATEVPTAVPAAPAAPTAVVEPTKAVSELGARLKPIWGANYKPDDGLGTVVCGAYAFSADYVLQQIQTSGLDVKNGFHLGIVPFYLNENYVVTAEDRATALKDGTLDCLLTTFDLMALEDPGIMTMFINESAGGDQMWARGMNSINDLRGKRIAFEANGPSAYFVYDLLATVGLKPTDVTLLPQPTQGAAIDVFNKSEADAVAGWEPVIFGAEKGGGKPLATSKDFRSILGGVVFSPGVIREKRAVIQAFHDSWFDALDVWEKDFGAASKSIADWGNNEYLGVSKENAEKDMRILISGVAQASLSDNARALGDLPLVTRRLQTARGLWALNGHKVPGSDTSKLIDPSFVLSAARVRGADPQAVNAFPNNTFSLGRTRAPVAVAATGTDTGTTATTDQATATPDPAAATVVATLPCSRFEFLPNSQELQPRSQQELRDCAVNVLTQNVTLFVRVKGSSAWPGPKGSVSQEQVELTAKGRAQSVVNYLVAQGIDASRFVVEWTLPPVENRETNDAAKLNSDRFVEISLLASGL